MQSCEKRVRISKELKEMKLAIEAIVRLFWQPKMLKKNNTMKRVWLYNSGNQESPWTRLRDESTTPK